MSIDCWDISPATWMADPSATWSRTTTKSLLLTGLLRLSGSKSGQLLFQEVVGLDVIHVGDDAFDDDLAAGADERERPHEGIGLDRARLELGEGVTEALGDDHEHLRVVRLGRFDGLLLSLARLVENLDIGTKRGP